MIDALRPLGTIVKIGYYDYEVVAHADAPGGVQEKLELVELEGKPPAGARRVIYEKVNEWTRDN